MLVIYWDGLPVHRQSPIQVITNLQQSDWEWNPRHFNSNFDTLPLNHQTTGVCCALASRTLRFLAESVRDSLHDACGWKCSDPYGVARFDLSELLLGQTVLQLRSAIVSSHVREPAWKPSVGLDGRLVPPPGVKEGPSVYFLFCHSSSICIFVIVLC